MIASSFTANTKLSQHDTMSHLRISIVGAGISGLVLARCLKHKGITATILEKAKASPHRNSYGITLHAHVFQPLLPILGLDEATFRKRVAVDSAIGGAGAIDGKLDSTSFKANKNRLESLLAEGLEVRWECEVQSVTPPMSADRLVGLQMAEGERDDADVVVGADGPHSVVRQAIAPEVEFTILPYAVYNGKRRIEPEEMTDSLGTANVLERRIGNAVFQVSISDRREEELSISYTYSRPGRNAGDVLFRPQRPKTAAREIPEELFEEVAAVRDGLDGPFRTAFDVDAMRNDRMLNWLMRSLRVDRQRLKTTAGQGIVLLGDAVHAESILGGEGANEAIEDGMRLAEVIANRGGENLESFYDERVGPWEKGIDESEARIREIHGQSMSNL